MFIQYLFIGNNARGRDAKKKLISAAFEEARRLLERPVDVVFEIEGDKWNNGNENQYLRGCMARAVLFARYVYAYGNNIRQLSSFCLISVPFFAPPINLSVQDGKVYPFGIFASYRNPVILHEEASYINTQRYIDIINNVVGNSYAEGPGYDNNSPDGMRYNELINRTIEKNIEIAQKYSITINKKQYIEVYTFEQEGDLWSNRLYVNTSLGRKDIMSALKEIWKKRC
ncbi:hypothetical protein [Candidatus Magnetaquicoccus inordinatus]|uniref:hypothetical protein n=1 Tax=Candidatus Magnetaquicoccus inordinatus TaxID=2496818 RepID=UPI00102ABF5E|nr:hypothetical protein [Candidatus Magnetaquicoccus inordinatus]